MGRNSILCIMYNNVLERCGDGCRTSLLKAGECSFPVTFHISLHHHSFCRNDFSTCSTNFLRMHRQLLYCNKSTYSTLHAMQGPACSTYLWFTTIILFIIIIIIYYYWALQHSDNTEVTVENKEKRLSVLMDWRLSQQPKQKNKNRRNNAHT